MIFSVTTRAAVPTRMFAPQIRDFPFRTVSTRTYLKIWCGASIIKRLSQLVPPSNLTSLANWYNFKIANVKSNFGDFSLLGESFLIITIFRKNNKKMSHTILENAENFVLPVWKIIMWTLRGYWHYLSCWQCSLHLVYKSTLFERDFVTMTWEKQNIRRISCHLFSYKYVYILAARFQP